MATIAILPIKGFGNAKQRLAPGLEPDARASLARAMAADVLAALIEVAGLDDVVVVTGDPVAAALASERGVRTVADPVEEGQSAAVALALTSSAGARALLVPGDCPLLDPAEVSALLAAPREEREVAVVPDRHGTGTNALLLCPHDAIAPAFGPGSCARHVALADAAGASSSIERLASLALDVDTPDDLAALEHVLATSTTGAPRTRAALAAVAQ